ncbi:MAG TPA: DNA primase [Candidatus Paceibacterota bacterium]|nr:DNA primase [Candidatus Paceibacterota bacterium]
MADTVAQIKSRLNLVDVISGYLRLQKAGANFKARCPFHNEKTPSFHINLERQIWHCFGCGKGGDMFSFLQDIEGIDFPEALGILANRAGVPLERFDARKGAERSKRGELLRISRLASAFFAKQLGNSDAGSRARKYLHERGVQDATITEWELGWAPNDWQALNRFLLKEGYAAKDIVAAGLASERQRSSDGSLYDRFRGRIMFPIRDHNGQVVGFTGRIFGRPETDKEAKYINSPQTPLYDKSRILFGLDKARLAVRQADACVLVEGNMDAILSWQAGVRNVVATSGTALTAEQLKLAGRYSRNLNFCFDADVAGAAATRRGIALALASGMQVRIATLDDAECKDPAEYIVKYGSGWTKAVDAAKPALQHYLDEALVPYDASSPESKRALLAAVGPFIRRLPGRVETTHWISRLADILRVPPADVRADLAALTDDLTAWEPRSAKEPERTGDTQSAPDNESPDPLEQALLSLLMKDFRRFHGDLAGIDAAWLSERTAALVAQLTEADPASFSWDAFIKSHEDGSWLLEFAYVRAQETWRDVEEAELGRQWQLVLSRLGRRHLEERARGMAVDIKAAEGMGDSTKLASLVADFARLKQDIARRFKN